MKGERWSGGGGAGSGGVEVVQDVEKYGMGRVEGGIEYGILPRRCARGLEMCWRGVLDGRAWRRAGEVLEEGERGWRGG